MDCRSTFLARGFVSVPLRGKEGAGHRKGKVNIMPASKEFPSPCGVRRVRDRKRILYYWKAMNIKTSFRPLAG